MHRTFTLTRKVANISKFHSSTQRPTLFLKLSDVQTLSKCYGSRLFSTDTKSPLRFAVQTFMIPHPEKEEKGGEDGIL